MGQSAVADDGGKKSPPIFERSIRARPAANRRETLRFCRKWGGESFWPKICLQYCRLREESEAFCWRTRIYPPRKACQTRHQQQDLHLVGLDITDNKIQTMPWAAILEKKENYLIGMLNKGVLAFPISKWVPGAGPTVKSGSKGKCRRLILTKTLEWTLNWCILQSMFDSGVGRFEKSTHSRWRCSGAISCLVG
ncbi:uncharacterized protein LOC132799286 [Ziziphus jujuba]|uniref:Autophagy-related protein 9 n=1 Tax=Ziziphus jujuba TaxID=326968 RepID=A0ABM3ZT13_ZIZJJ|nr:uncharacterized protein LOC132799286 [Ziziphus jujuba]